MSDSIKALMEIIFFVLGAIVASFVGVISGRLYTGQGFLTGRSRCDACNSSLPPSALVPVFSFLLSRGKSLCCGAKISAVSPTTEVLLGCLFVLAYINLGVTPELLLFLVSLSVLLSLVLYDLSHQILPSSLLIIFVVSSGLSRFLMSPLISEFFHTFVTAILIGTSLALIHYASSGRAMGLADAPLAFGLSLFVGPSALSGFIFSFWIGAIIGIAMLLHRPRGSRMGVEVPFAPYLAAGFLLAYFTQWNIFAIIEASLL